MSFTTTTTSYNYDLDLAPSVRAQIAPRALTISRSSNFSAGAGAGAGGAGGSRGGSRALVSSGLGGQTGIAALKNSRDKEKKDIQDLNERFASYIEKVRFLEAQNRKLSDELDRLKSKWGIQTTQIKAIYETELAEAKRLIEEAEKERARLELRVAALEEQLEELRKKLEEATRVSNEIRDRINQQNQQLADLEAEAILLRLRVQTFQGDQQLAQIQDAINRARIDLDNETLLHLDAESNRKALEDELDFLKQLHEQELKELAGLAYRDTTSENREFWKNEMGGALREIQQNSDEKIQAVRNDLETFYNLKVQEFRTSASRQSAESVHSKEETTRLRSQIAELHDRFGALQNRHRTLTRELEDLTRERDARAAQLQSENGTLTGTVVSMRAELEAINRELQELQDTKLSLELEIAAYRKLLEGEENRQGLKHVVDSLFGAFSAAAHAGGDYATVRTVVKGEVQAKITNQRSAKGATAVGDCSVDGKFVTIENTGRKEEDISGWKVSRSLNGSDSSFAKYKFDNNVVLKAGQKFKLWAKGSLPSDAVAGVDVETSVENWGFGSESTVTKITNQAGEDRATLIQKTAAQ